MITGLDKIDKRLISQYIENPKAQATELARKIGVHPNTVFTRVKKLEKSGIIKKYTTIVDFKKMGYGIESIIFMVVRKEKGWEDILKPVASFPEVCSFMIITGENDAIASVRVKDMDGMALVLKRIHDTGIVIKTTTSIVIDSYKSAYEFNPTKSLCD